MLSDSWPIYHVKEVYLQGQVVQEVGLQGAEENAFECI